MKNDKPLNYKQCVQLTLFVTIVAIMMVGMLLLRTIKEFYYELLFFNVPSTSSHLVYGYSYAVVI